MTDREQTVTKEMADKERKVTKETAILEVFNNQFPTLTKQVIDNLKQLSMVGEKWPTTLLMVLGMLLLGAALVIKLVVITSYPVNEMEVRLSPFEFSTLIISASGLLVVGALFSLYQARSWRKIVLAQQVVGTEILNKQIDIAKEMVVGRHSLQGRQLILLPARIRKRYRR